MVLLRPCTGHPSWMEATLLSTGEVSYSGELRIRFSVADAGDAAHALCEDVAAQLRAAGWDADVVVLPPEGPNQKAGQVAAAVDTLCQQEAILLSVDADVDLSGVDLEPVLAPLLRDETVGVVWIPPAERGTPAGWGDRASAALLSGSLHAFPLLAGLDPNGMVGKLFAIHPRAFEALSPVRELGWYLGEDMEIARRVRAAGLRIGLVGRVALSRAQGRAFRSVIQRFTRWLLVIRGQRPALLLTYPLFFGATAPILTLAAVACLSPGGWARILGGYAAAVTLISRWTLAMVARRISGARARPLRAVLDVALSELTIWWAFGRALVQRRVIWAGRSLRLSSSGRLEDARARQ